MIIIVFTVFVNFNNKQTLAKKIHDIPLDVKKS